MTAKTSTERARVGVSTQLTLWVEWDVLGRTFVHRLPVHSIWCIFPGFSSSLNFAGMSVVLCGMCRSPMHSTSTIFLQGSDCDLLLLKETQQKSVLMRSQAVTRKVRLLDEFGGSGNEWICCFWQVEGEI